MNGITRKRTTASERLIVSLPKSLVLELRRFATKYRGGNKSGFVADAIESISAGFVRPATQPGFARPMLPQPYKA
jgi:hypothetical protein